jgi:hypothetical protein
VPRPSQIIPPALPLILWAAASLAQVEAPQRDAARNAVEPLKVQATVPLQQLMRVAIVDGQLTADLAPDAAPQMEQMRFEVEGTDAIWVVRKRVLGGNAAQLYTTITRYDFDVPADRLWSTSISTRPGTLSIYAMTGDSATGMRIRLTQSGNSVSASCHMTKPGFQSLIFSAQAASLKQLQAEHPAEIRAYLAPVLRNLTGRFVTAPAAADVYRAFTSIPPDPAIERKLDQIVIRLEADSQQDRDHAQKELAALGIPGVLAAVRRDTSDLGAEARNRLLAFIERYANVPENDIPSARNDGHFLLDCLDNDDPAVRLAAKEALETLLRQPVEFDLRSGGKYRTLAIEALRKKFDAQLRPPTPRAPATRKAVSE